MKQEAYQKLLDKILDNPREYGITNCFLCDREHIVFIGIYLPFDGTPLAKALEQPKDKTRSVIYGLCEDCLAEDRGTDVVEKKILDQLQDGQGINLVNEP